MNVRAAFRYQAEACRALGSPFQARLMDLIADRMRPGSAVADAVLGWAGDPSTGADNLPLRLGGALHALKIRGVALVDNYPPQVTSDDALWSAVTTACREHAGEILERLRFPPQTNEVRRSAVILAALARLQARFARPVHLIELGASAGLNLRADKFLLSCAGVSLGPHDSPVQLTPDWTGPAPNAELPGVLSRQGVDLNPIDPSSENGRLSLLSFLWPDQADRIARTDAAIAIARSVPADLAAGDAGAWLEASLEPGAANGLRVVFHTVAWQYFPQATKSRALAAVTSAAERSTAEAPVARLSMENEGGQGATVRLWTWPDGRVEDLGRADFHGRWIDWTVEPI